MQGDEEDKADPEKVTRLREQLRKERSVSESEEEGEVEKVEGEEVRPLGRRGGVVAVVAQCRS